MNTILLPKPRMRGDPKINVKFSHELKSEFLNKQEIDDLLENKNKIDNVGCHKIWDKAKKLSNDYELIHLPNKKVKCESIAEYEPLSRSYFKLWEIIFDFNLFPDSISEKICVAGIAEGPGGFLEAINNYRRRYFSIKDNIYGITLRSTDNDIPGWKKAREFLDRNRNIKVIYGVDNTGNIYNYKNIEYFKTSLEDKAYITTADGGFDFSIDFNKQEQLSYRIIFCEIVSALSVQKKGGIFVCKFFDMYTMFTIKLLYLINIFFDKVYITKPLTSRPANSEKYIVAKNFLGISDKYLNKLYQIVNLWDIVSNSNLFINDIFDMDIPELFLQKIKEYNTHNYKVQIENINKTLNIINSQSDLTSLNTSIEEQSTKAKNWCIKYDIKINQKSTFLK